MTAQTTLMHSIAHQKLHSTQTIQTSA